MPFLVKNKGETSKDLPHLARSHLINHATKQTRNADPGRELNNLLPKADVYASP